MLSLASLLVTGHLLTSPLHLADFQLTPPPQTYPSAALPTPDVGTAERSEASDQPRYSIAYGFGNGVPLSFAVKQIVPAPFRVIYRKDVDQDALVSWTGNRPWNQALWLALRGCGLHMALAGRTVTIGN